MTYRSALVCANDVKVRLVMHQISGGSPFPSKPTETFWLVKMMRQRAQLLLNTPHQLKQPKQILAFEDDDTVNLILHQISRDLLSLSPQTKKGEKQQQKNLSLYQCMVSPLEC